MTTGIWIQVSSDPVNIHIHTNTNRCLFSFHCPWPSQCLSGVLFWHRSGTNNLCFLPFFCAHPITLTFSGGGKRDIDDCFLWLLFNRVSEYGGAWVIILYVESDILFQILFVRIIVGWKYCICCLTLLCKNYEVWLTINTWKPIRINTILLCLASF